MVRVEYQNYYLIYFIIKMNRTSSYRTPQKRANNSQSKPTSPVASPINTNIMNPLYYCHYKNAMYMGGIKSFKKEGKGILLHDSGLSILSSYSNDQMHGHNIFFAQHCLLSAEFSKGKIVQAVYRTDGFLGHFFFNSDEQLQGRCKLFNYTTKSITYAVFKKGIMSQKSEQTDTLIINRVFDLKELEFLIGRSHAGALKYQIQKSNNIIIQKYGNKIIFGFDKNGLINGLGFTLIFRGSHGGYNPETLRHEDQFELKILQRGYLLNSMLNGFGQKLFKNGNLYIGEFKNGVFEGNGVLINQTKKNWVSGYFQKGNLIDMFDYNNEGMQKRYDKIVQALHEKKTNWINNEIITLSLAQFDRLMEKVISQSPVSAVKGLEQRKLEVLKRIQQNFVCDTNTVPNFLESARNDLNNLDNEKQRTRQSMKKFVQSFTPITQEKLTSRQTQNQNNQSFSQTKQPLRKSTDIRKSKIFEKNTTSDRYLRVDNASVSRNRSSRLTPQTKKKIFNQTASSTGYKFRPNKTLNQVNSPENVGTKGTELQAKDWAESNSQVNHSQASEDLNMETKKSANRLHKKEVSKSKIFDSKQRQVDEIAPKFIYTRVDTIPESERRRRLGLEDNS